MGGAVILEERKPLIVKKRGGGERTIPADKWWIDRNTPRGEDADLYERKPHGGNRWLPWSDVLGQPE